MLRDVSWLLALLLCSACPDGDDETSNDDNVASDDDDSGDDDDSASAPNILLLIVDDFGLGAASLGSGDPCYAIGDIGDDPSLPNLAALCAGARVFDTAWASPTCSPTRASILTGTLPHQHGVFAPQDAQNQIDPEATWTLPRALEGSGYATANVGKWHLSTGDDDPRRAGWDHFAGVLRGALPDYFAWERSVDGVSAPTETYATTANVDDALAWLDATGDAPWLLWLAVNAPHTPWHVPPTELHDLDELEGYADQQRATPWFKAALQALDTEFGRLLAEVEARGELEQTVVIVLGDNGTDRSAADAVFDERRSKGSLNEGGIHVPLFVSGPGVVPGRSAELVTVADLFPTILELAGVDVEAARAEQAPEVELFGRSLLPLLAGEAPGDWRELLLVSSRPSEGSDSTLAAGSAVRSATDKLICHDDGEVELFDLEQDPFEDEDLFEAIDVLPAELLPIYEGLKQGAEALLGEPLPCP